MYHFYGFSRAMPSPLVYILLSLDKADTLIPHRPGQEYFKDMPLNFTAEFHFLWAVDTRNKKKEDGELGLFLEIYKIYSLEFNTSKTVFTTLEEGLEGF